MAIAIDASTPAPHQSGTSTSGLSAYSSNSFSPPAGSLIVAVLVDTTHVGTTAFTSVTSSAGSLSFSRLDSNTVSSRTQVDVWLADCPSSLSGITLTATASGNIISDGRNGAFFVLVLTGAAAKAGQTGHVAKSTGTWVGTTGVTLSAAASSSWIFAGFADWESADTPTFPAGQTDVFNSITQLIVVSATGDSEWLQGNSAAGNSNLTMKVTTPTVSSANNSMMAFEILATTSQSITPTAGVNTAATATVTTSAPGLTSQATDNFNRANSNVDGSLGWTRTVDSSLPIVSNQVVGSATVSSGAWRTGETYTSDQYSQVVVGTVPLGLAWIGTSVRNQDDRNCYLAIYFQGLAGIPTSGTYEVDIYTRVASTYTRLTNQTIGSTPLPAGSVFRIEVSGNFVQAFVNGAQVTSVHDNTFPSGGSPGIQTFDVGSLDNWDGGNVSSGVALAPSARVATQATVLLTAPTPLAPTARASTQATVVVTAPTRLTASAASATAATATVTTPAVGLAIDSQEPSGVAQRSTNPTTWTFNNVAGNLLVVGAVSTNNSLTSLGAPTYNGVAMTGGPGISWESGNSVAQLFYLVNPALGSHTVSVPSGGGGHILAGAISFSGADTTTPFGTTASAKFDTGSGTTHPQAGAITAASGNYVLGVGGYGAGSAATADHAATFALVGSGATSGDDIATDIALSSGAAINAGFTFAAADYWGIVAAEIRAAPTGIPLTPSAGVVTAATATVTIPSSSPFTLTPVTTDNFNRADTSGATGIGPGWTTGTGSLAIHSNEVTGLAGVIAGNYRDGSGGDTYSSDQYSQCVVGSINSGIDTSFIGLTVRNQVVVDINNYLAVYEWHDGTAGLWPLLGIYKRKDGGPNLIMAQMLLGPGGDLSAGDVLTFVAVGSRLTLLVNGVEMLAADAGENELTGGKPGVEAYQVMTLDNWEGGNAVFTPVTPAATIVQHNSAFSSSAVTTLSVTLPSPVTPGNTLVAFTGWDLSSAAVGTISDDDPGGDFWRLVDNISLPGSTYNIAAWRTRVRTAGTRTITFTPPTSSTFIRLAVVEVSGVNAIDQLVSNIVPVGSSPSTINAGTVTPQTGTEVVLGWMVGVNGAGAPGAGFTSLESVHTSLVQGAVGPPAGTALSISCANGTPFDGYVAIGVSFYYSPVPVLEQKASAFATTVDHVSVTMPVHFEKGNALVVLGSWSETSAPASVSDDVSDSFTQVDFITSTALGFRAYMWWTQVATDGGSVVTVYPIGTGSAANFQRLFVLEYSNVQGFDGAHASADGNGTKEIQMTLTTSHPNAIVVGQGISNNGTDPGDALILPGSTRQLTQNVESAYDAVAPTSGGAYTTGFASIGNTQWLAESAAFYAPTLAPAAPALTPAAQATTAATALVTAPAALALSASTKTAATSATTAPAVMSPTARSATQATLTLTVPSGVPLAPVAGVQTQATASVAAATRISPQAAVQTQATLSVSAGALRAPVLTYPTSLAFVMPVTSLSLVVP